jgi:hypothetical protein
MKTSGTKEVWLMVFDQNRMKPWEERSFWNTENYEGLTIHVIGC